MDFRPSAEQDQLRRLVADVAAGFGHPYYASVARSGGRADELWAALADAGLPGVAVPQAYGGGGAGLAELAIVCEELATAGCPLLLLIVSSAIGATVIGHAGSAEQRRDWLPGLAAGRWRVGFALTEADAGSNTHNLSTRAYPDRGGYVLTGAKQFITGVDEVDALLVVARIASGSTTDRGELALFVVDTGAPGLSAAAMEMEVPACERQFLVTLDEVRVPAGRRVGAAEDGLATLFAGLNPERVTSAATATGIGRYALAKASRYAIDRCVWGQPIGGHQGLAHPLAEAHIRLEQARLLTEKAAWLFDHGLPAASAANMAKLAAADAGMAALDQSITVHGGSGLAREVGLADLWGIARLLRSAPVSREMVLNYVAQHDLGLPRSY